MPEERKKTKRKAQDSTESLKRKLSKQFPSTELCFVESNEFILCPECSTKLSVKRARTDNIIKHYERKHRIRVHCNW